MLLAELGPRGKGRLLEVTQLIEQGADVNCKDYKGYTPIYNGTNIYFLGFDQNIKQLFSCYEQ